MSWSLVAHLGQGSTNTATFTSSSINTTNANLIVVVVTDTGGGTTISDNFGNNYSLANGPIGAFATATFYTTGPTVGAGHTFTATSLGSTSPAIFVQAWTASSVPSLEQANQNTALGTTSSQPGSITPISAGQLIVTGVEYEDSTNPLGINGTFTISDQLNLSAAAHHGGGAAYLIQGAAAAVNPTWSTTNNTIESSTIASFSLTTQTWQEVQAASAESAPNTQTVSATFPINVRSGTKLIAAVSIGVAATQSITSVKDGANNAMTMLVDTTFFQNGRVYLWAMDTPAGDVGTKPTITATMSNSDAGLSIFIQEVSGLLPGNTTAMLDGTAGTNNGNSNSPTNVSYTSTKSGEYLAAVYGDPGNAITYTNPAGFSGDLHGINTSSIADINIARKNSTGGAESTAYAINGTEEWAQILVAFKLAASGNANTGGFFRLMR